MRTYKVRYLSAYRFIVVTATEYGKNAEYGFSTEYKDNPWKRALAAIDRELYL